MPAAKKKTTEISSAAKIISVITLLVTTLLALGVAWGATSTTISENTRRIEQQESLNKNQNERLSEQEKRSVKQEEILKNIDSTLKEMKVDIKEIRQKLERQQKPNE